MKSNEIAGLTAMQLMIKSLDKVQEKSNSSSESDMINRILQACKELAEGLLEIEKAQMEDAYRNSDFETYYNNRYYNQKNK